MPIHLLPPQLANQIAAGEVVERPASVVKELVENSLDAGASRIELEIEKGGHKRIKIRDNGSGIAKDELELALSRHATSKIATLDDLEHILSLGFRGEALASISSVSRLTLTSRPADQDQAWQAYCEGSQMAVRVQPAAHPQGTTIDVADLFYNTPARRKFLRTEKTEFQHIEETIRRIALSHPQVAFSLHHNGKMVRRYGTAGEGQFPKRIASVLGQNFVNNAIHLHSEYDGLSITAWLGNESTMRSSSDCQFSFVNGRGMRDKLILHAIRQAYESVWGVLEQPAFVVYLNVDPRDVDVNVHPAKHEVRFQQSRLVHDFICKAVCDALEGEGPGQRERDEPGGRKKPSSAVTHDYIRPLQSAGEPAYSSHPPRPLSSGNPAAGRSSKSPVTGEYAAQYTRLMSPVGNTEGEREAITAHMPLGKQWRMYQQDEACWLLGIHPLVNLMMYDQVQQASTRQPLLMPVAVHSDVAGEANIALLESAGFEIDRVAGKIRLLQVPAGCRHFPWISLFPALLQHVGDDPAALFRSATSDITNWPDDVVRQTWQWLDSHPLSQQWAWIRQFGKVRAASELIDWWQ